MRRLARPALTLALLLAALAAAGQLLARRRTSGGDEDDEVSMATCLGGIQRSLRSTALRHVRVAAWLGGADLDLCEATLDPAGATLVAEARLGGVKVTVPAEWHVTVEQEARAGGVLARVTDPETLPAGAPRLHVEARAGMGGILVTTPAERGSVSPRA